MLKTISPVLWGCFFVIFLGLNTGCQEKANKKSLNPICMKEFKNYFKVYPLERLEHKFFSDRRARHLLKWHQIQLKGFKELESSATLSTYLLSYSFKDPQGNRVELINTSRTGGVSLSGSNRASYELECKIFWNSFKGKKIDSEISIHMIDLEKDNKLDRLIYSQ